MHVQHYNGDYRRIADIFYDAIHTVATQQYTSEQVHAWAPYPIGYDRWYYRCELKRPFIVCDADTAVGFIELDPDGHIDCHYVHSTWNRRGVGGLLLDHVERVCRALGKPRLYVEASLIAVGLYEQRGFYRVKEQHVVVGSQLLQNFLLEKMLV
ncbi:MAG: GNAT family N-acetyltransferase [Chloroflexi bacterium AL-W]|nr:GNAT family N-acetyltransferase [Chloroflexi bacterium AL-N1]NOK65880.1 GNAT family N-acetyltransferase [Chloroflexi bacterium AL-N10]NOK74179.1 GNAT family N-acetyltransferase [Chloroflexi bacterium AL-N5]NOK80913.1 GNAT family N-acetyltransferase [Chloroflexi bacterium AL-W]NOK88437.1 GNAT family N-acetyltransferase [Chloroflexi bacterium AL-N15]